MYHTGIVQHESERPYSNRSYILGQMDNRHFDALNSGNQVSALNGYCLDALDELPGGSMKQFVSRPAQYYVSRGMSLAEQQYRSKLATKLINEILNETK